MKLIVAAAALAFATAAGAQDARPAAVAPNATLDPEAVAAARELMRASGADAQIEETAQRTAQMGFEAELASFQRHTGQPMPPELRSALEQTLHAHLAKYMPEVETALLEEGAKTYARYFTTAEIRELQRLQTNPVMVKFRTIGPIFMTEMMQIGVTAVTRHEAELEAALTAVIDKWVAEQTPAAPPKRS
jgi:hypothetical protein